MCLIRIIFARPFKGARLGIAFIVPQPVYTSSEVGTISKITFKLRF